MAGILNECLKEVQMRRVTLQPKKKMAVKYLASCLKCSVIRQTAFSFNKLKERQIDKTPIIINRAPTDKSMSSIALDTFDEPSMPLVKRSQKKKQTFKLDLTKYKAKKTSPRGAYVPAQSERRILKKSPSSLAKKMSPTSKYAPALS